MPRLRVVFRCSCSFPPRTTVGASVTMREVSARVWAQDGVRGFWAGRGPWNLKTPPCQGSISIFQQNFSCNDWGHDTQFICHQVLDIFGMCWSARDANHATSCHKVFLAANDHRPGLWPNVTRTFLANAAELGTYDEAKSRLVPVLGDGFFAHVFCRQHWSNPSTFLSLCHHFITLHRGSQHFSYWERDSSAACTNALQIIFWSRHQVMAIPIRPAQSRHISLQSLQVAASGAAGFTSACVSTPADVVKTRLMNSAGEDVKQYRGRRLCGSKTLLQHVSKKFVHMYMFWDLPLLSSGMAHAFSKILTEEGVPALYKGFLPICVRVLADPHHLDVCACVCERNISTDVKPVCVFSLFKGRRYFTALICRGVRPIIPTWRNEAIVWWGKGELIVHLYLQILAWMSLT